MRFEMKGTGRLFAWRVLAFELIGLYFVRDRFVGLCGAQADTFLIRPVG